MDISEYRELLEKQFRNLQPSCGSVIRIFAQDKQLRIEPPKPGGTPGEFITRLSAKQINKGLTAKEWEALLLQIFKAKGKGLLL